MILTQNTAAVNFSLLTYFSILFIRGGLSTQSSELSDGVTIPWGDGSTLSFSNIYKFKLIMTVTSDGVSVAGSVEARVETAGEAPFGGSLTCTPVNGSMLERRVLLAEGVTNQNVKQYIYIYTFK